VSARKNQARRLFIVTYIIASTLFLVEIFSAFYLYIGGDQKAGDKIYLEKFPVSFRMLWNNKLRLLASSTKVSSSHIREFEPLSLTGFYDPSLIKLLINGKYHESITSFDKFIQKLSSHRKAGGKLLIAVGGSTTASAQLSNWPAPLSELLYNKNYIVINAGHNGYSTLASKTLLQEVILPAIYPIIPNLVVNLSGTNDISLAAASMMLRDKKIRDSRLPSNVIYNPYYTVNDLTISQADKNKFGISVRGLVNSLSPIIPSFSRLLHLIASDGVTSDKTKPLFTFLGSVSEDNIFRLCNQIVVVPQDAGPFVLDDLSTGTIRSYTYDNISSYMDNKPISLALFQYNLNICADQRIRSLAKIRNYPAKLTDLRLIKAAYFRQSLSMRGALNAQSIKYYEFIQPISRGFANRNTVDILSADQIPVHWYMRGDFIGFNLNYPILDVYDSIVRESTARSFQTYLKPVSIKQDINSYTWDNIHYNKAFSRMIAKFIANNLNIN